MAEAPIYALKNVKLSFGAHQLFSDVNLYINRGDKISLVGRNGCGKSTLLKIIAKETAPDVGEIFVQPGCKIGYMPQEPDLSGFKTLKDVITESLPAEAFYKADILIDLFHIAATQDPATASGGERRKASLAKALVNEPDILLLD